MTSLIVQSTTVIAPITPLLTEISHAMERLLTYNESTLLNLHSLPLSSHDITQLSDLLGKGEVEAYLYALGKSIFWETHFSGVWWIEHYNNEEHIINRSIEITRCPTLLLAQTEDIQSSWQRLQGLI